MENVINQYSGTCLTGVSDGTVTTFACTKGATSQYWTQIPSSDIPYFELVVNSTGECLQNSGGRTVNIVTCNISDTYQNWYINSLQIENRATRECLLYQGDGNLVIAYNCDATFIEQVGFY